MKRKVLIVVLAAVLTSCAQTDVARTQAVDTLAGASDRAREDAELILCRGITVGAWVRAYGTDAERAAAWKTLCSNQVKATP